MPNDEDKHPYMSKHLILILALLVCLVVTELMIFYYFKGDTTTSVKDVMALTFGTFGTWIGAGAAYFFGRENMKTATDSLLKLNQTNKEKLSTVTIREMKPKPLQKFLLSDTLTKVIDWLKKDTWQFVFAVVDEKDKFRFALGEEAIYRYVLDELKLTANSKEVVENLDKKIGDIKLKALVEHYQLQDDEKLRGLIEFGVELTEDMTASVASEKIEQEHKLVGIVLDSTRKPTGYISTNDIRKFLMNK
jgi:hypothetical protein